jgi:hypothetical protein
MSYLIAESSERSSIRVAVLVQLTVWGTHKLTWLGIAVAATVGFDGPGATPPSLIWLDVATNSRWCTGVTTLCSVKRKKAKPAAKKNRSKLGRQQIASTSKYSEHFVAPELGQSPASITPRLRIAAYVARSVEREIKQPKRERRDG